MKIKKYLEISTQHKEEIEKAVEFNENNNYEYILRDDNNLIEYDNVAYLLRVGYKICEYADCLTLKHKNYKEEMEKVG